MTKANLLREWILAEIEYAFAQREVGEDGYGKSARKEGMKVNELFEKIDKMIDA